MRRLFLFVGRSGSGKTTVADGLCANGHLHTAVSMTTRPPRYEGERGYNFVTEEELLKHKVLTHAVFDGNHYGVSEEELDNSDIFIVEPSSIHAVQHHYAGKRVVKVIYFDLDPLEAAKRMRARGDAEAKIKRRLWNDANTFHHIPYGATIVSANRPVREIVKDLQKIIYNR